MPLAERRIEPVYLGRRALKEEEEGEEVVQVAVTHNALLGALVQLASLVRHADDLFCDLADECQLVVDHTDRILSAVKRIKQGVGKLDSKQVQIPVGDLKRFSAVRDHHLAKHGHDSALFINENRPYCLKARYSLCEVNPVGALRGADQYRKDGLRSSHLFKLWPIVLQEHRIRTPDFNEARTQGQAKSFKKNYKRLTPRAKTVHSVDSLDTLGQDGSEGDTPVSAREMSQSQPSIMIAVDTSGAGFRRMSSYRQSLKGAGGFPKGTASLDRKRRRRTVSGVSGQIMQEIEVFEHGKRSSRNTPRNYSFDDLDAHLDLRRQSDSFTQMLEDMDAKMEEKAEQQRASREPKLLKFLPCRRSRSLPRCVKMSGGHCSGVMEFENEAEEKGKEKSIHTASSGYTTSSSLSLGSTGSSSTSSRFARRSSIIGSRIRSFVSGTLRPRPKSLDLDAMVDDEADAEEDDDDNSSTTATATTTTASRSTLKRKMSPSMPDDISSLASSRESQVGPGTYYYFNSSTLPRAQARKYDFPWDSLPKDWTTAVKLREISRRRREERNSSSGNWSGSSNRQSLDSANSSTVPSSTSQHSLARDSGRDSPTLHDHKDFRRRADPDSKVSSFLPASSGPDGDDTEQWLASLAQRAAAREDATAAGSEVTDSLKRLSMLTRQNIDALEETFSPVPLRPLMLDDEASIHSQDQEGFYTSFHTDSGLRRSTGTLLDEDGAGEGEVRESASCHSLCSTNTVDSVIFRPMGNVVPGKATSTPSSLPTLDACDEAETEGKRSKVRPPPPVRTSSRLTAKSDPLSSLGNDPSDNSDSLFKDDVSICESSLSESDQEIMHARLQSKTRISSHSIPSWCAISDQDSPESSSSCLDSASGPQPSFSLSAGKAARAPEPDSSSSLTDSTFTDVTDDALEREEGGDKMWNSTLPRAYMESKVWEEDSTDASHSWPRSRRSQQPTAGILKRDKSPAGSLKPKTLNFAPVVSLFDAHSDRGEKVPLQPASSSASSSSSLDCSSDASSRRRRQASPVKVVPSSSLVSQQRLTGTTNKASQGLNPALPNAAPQLGEKRVRDVLSESDRSVSSSESSLASLSECGQGGYIDMSGCLGHRAPDQWSTDSSAGLSDLDPSTASLSSNHSTPTNSTLNLCSDDQPTPVNSPSLQKEERRRSSGSRGKREASGRHSLGSFASNASTEAAPASWVDQRTNLRSMSGDSGFSSPTTPTSATPVSAHKTSPTSRQAHRASSAAVPPFNFSTDRKHMNMSHSVGAFPTQQQSSRSDSYRAATKDSKPRTRDDRSVRHKTRPHSSAHASGSIPKSQSCPSGVVADTDSATRADSYRFAVRNTQGVVGDMGTRNTSYRIATEDHDDTVFDARMEAISAWERKQSTQGRDIRRMGITDIDQLKCYDSDSSSKTSTSSLSAKLSSKGFAGISSSRKKMKPEVENLLKADKTPSPEAKRLSKVANRASKDKSKTQSSTYIRFDSIFERGDDLYSSTDTLRAESVEMIASEDGCLMSDKVVGKLPPGRVRGGGGGRKSVDDKAVMSILGSIKTTIKSISGKNTATAAPADKDMWRYEGGV